ncbi:hypothetical protein DICPUDRAFT_157341 [Dictyostelium purpureum]|uniref:Uncharacterized protein n=1 Tax=Dictyostelium purpureum TaxID=5786 RepID=F0ZYW3_DICPU|nr:uncharacterized protein DICPUDRAFT_157341 [Dictyostelium purpureum]EGC30865.1 hypothetical protein DICPUDRAFT_157341 [Dictyostelium purpureum]|eukprot:XP_003292602.1 hypothetical protein DICPUDRAFT_157341 [Dictyostelium purpureum]
MLLYIYGYIIDFIIFQKINGQLYKFRSAGYNGTINNNEIINYALVCKSWFKMTRLSLELSLTYLCFDFFKPLMANNINNSQFKIIKNPNFRLFHSYKDYYEFVNNNDDFNNSNNNNLKVLINIEGPIEDFNPYIDYPNIKFQDNVEFDFKINYGVKDVLNKINNLKINKIALVGMLPANFLTHRKDRMDIVKKLLPKRVEYRESFSHTDYTNIFEMESLQFIEIIGGDHVEPKTLARINNEKTKLETANIPIYFHDIIRAVNEVELPTTNIYTKKICRNLCQNIEFPSHIRNQVKNDFVMMINTLSENRTIKCLFLINICYKGECNIDNLDYSFVTNSLKSLILNNRTIKDLGLHYFDFMDNNIISALKETRTLRTLTIVPIKTKLLESITTIIEQIVSHNKSIRDLNFFNLDWTEVEDLYKIVEIFKNNSKSIQLYSVVFLFRKYTADSSFAHFELFKDISNKLFDLHLNIYEINIYSLFEGRKIQFQILNNKIFIYK